MGRDGRNDLFNGGEGIFAVCQKQRIDCLSCRHTLGQPACTANELVFLNVCM